MNTQITESDIIAWLRARAEATGIKGLRLEASSGGFKTFYATLGDGSAFGFGNTIADALTEFLANYKTPAQRAADLRAKADAIEKEAAL